MTDHPASGTAKLIPAATLILFREIAGSAPHILVLKRSDEMAFAAGALVFPGGRRDQADLAFATQLGADAESIDDISSRIAAIRETIEEVGIAVGLVPAPSPHQVVEIRNGLAAGKDFAALLAASGLSIAIDALTLFARWIPPTGTSRRYDTRFYVAPAPEDALEEADGTESIHAFWESAEAILAGVETGDHHVIFPTRCNLQRLARLESFQAAISDAGNHGHHVINSWEEKCGDETFLCIRENTGYPVTRFPLARVHRS